MTAEKSRPLIALLTDFGLRDNYVGVMKGVIARECPAAAVVDITHSIPPHSILAASLALTGAYGYFPDDAVFVVVVDPGVGTDRKIVALRDEARVFIAPDNGVLYPLAKRLGDVEFWEIRWRPEGGGVGATFHGRDIFAPVAAMLAGGARLGDFGGRIDCIERFEAPEPGDSGEGVMRAEIIYIDGFGNLMTNVSRERLADFAGGGDVAVEINDVRIEGLGRTYADVRPGSPALVVNSMGYLEIALSRGSAADVYHIGVGDGLKIVRI